MFKEFDNSNFFIVASKLLGDQEARWSVYDFEKEKVDKNMVSMIFRLLEKEDVLERLGGRRGKGSYCLLRRPKTLLKLCETHFIKQDVKTQAFVSKMSHPEEIPHRLQASGHEIFLGKTSGVSPEHRHVLDGKLYILCTTPAILSEVEKTRMAFDLSLHPTKMGDVLISIPRYKKFLRYQPQMAAGIPIPSNFYTYLSLKNWDYPMAQAQLEHMEKNLRDTNAFFV